MEFESINMHYNGRVWQNITGVWEHNGSTLRVNKNDTVYKISAEENYNHELLHKYRPYFEKLVKVNIGGNNSNIWCPLDVEGEYKNSIEECLEQAISYLNSNDI